MAKKQTQKGAARVRQRPVQEAATAKAPKSLSNKKVNKAKPATRRAPGSAPVQDAKPLMTEPPADTRPGRTTPEPADDFARIGDARLLNSARAGQNELFADLKEHTESSPALTAGDLDANWRDAYAQGDESPGGDNPTPDQDRVDDIGRALGIQYDDDEELLGGEEITRRDEHRWELDPASRERDEDADE